MKQHPVPQHISSYEFHLIGDMTLKQFGYLLAGGIIAFLFYISSFNFLIKSGGLVFSLLLGISFAFLSLQERPLDRWVINFFKAIYSPTKYVWKKSKRLPVYLQITPPSLHKIQQTLLQKEPSKKVPLAEYLQSLPQPLTQPTLAEKTEVSRLEKISHLLQTPLIYPSPQVPIPPPEVQKEGLKIRPLTQKENIRKVKFQAKTQPPPPLKKPKRTKAPSLPKQPITKTPQRTLKIIKPSPRPPKPTSKAILKPTLPFPEKPTRPNLIIGMVKDKNGKIVENAILEIQDQKGIPQRALKTNKLGQFRIATPLKNGTFSILVEKEGLNFDTIKITLSGKTVPPIEIQAK